MRIQGSPRITQKALKSVEWNLASSWTASRQEDHDGSFGWPLHLLLLHHKSLCIHNLYSFQSSSVPQRWLISEDRCFGDWVISWVMRFSLLNLRVQGKPRQVCTLSKSLNHIDSDSKESAHNSGELGLIPGLGRSSGEGREWQPTPVFLPGEFHGREAWRATVHGIANRHL